MLLWKVPAGTAFLRGTEGAILELQPVHFDDVRACAQENLSGS